MSQIIIRPIVTEKLTAQGEKENRYGFVVDRTSNKVQIKQAVEKEYNAVSYTHLTLPTNREV